MREKDPSRLSPHLTCTQHSGLMGRLNLMIALMTVGITGIIALLSVTSSTYVAITQKIGELDTTVAVTAEKAVQVEGTQKHIWTRLDKLEGNR